jgi:hypothetical protein
LLQKFGQNDRIHFICDIKRNFYWNIVPIQKYKSELSLYTFLDRGSIQGRMQAVGGSPASSPCFFVLGGMQSISFFVCTPSTL